jgi:hypothetical protein
MQRYGKDVPETVIELHENGSLEPTGSREDVWSISPLRSTTGSCKIISQWQTGKLVQAFMNRNCAFIVIGARRGSGGSGLQAIAAALKKWGEDYRWRTNSSRIEIDGRRYFTGQVGISFGSDRTARFESVVTRTAAINTIFFPL